MQVPNKVFAQVFGKIVSQKLTTCAKNSPAKSAIRNQIGMTLIEIMIVIAIIAGLMAVLGSNVMNSRKKAQIEQTKSQIKEIGKQLESYNLSCNSYPTSEQGLQALMVNPGTDACPNWGPEPYLKKNQIKDQWGTAFMYESDGTKYVIRSLGPTKKEGGAGALTSEEE